MRRPHRVHPVHTIYLRSRSRRRRECVENLQQIRRLTHEYAVVSVRRDSYANFFKIDGNSFFKFVAFFKCIFELRREFLYLHFKWNPIVNLVGKSDIPTRREHITRFSYVLSLYCLGKAENVFVFRRILLAPPRAHGIGNFLDVLIGENDLLTRYRLNLLPRIYKERLAGAIAESVAFLIFCYKPERNRQCDIVEKFWGTRDDNIDKIGFNNFLTNFAFASANCKRTICHNKPCHSVWRKVVDEMLYPREVCVARRWCTVLETRIVFA